LTARSVSISKVRHIVAVLLICVAGAARAEGTAPPAAPATAPPGAPGVRGVDGRGGGPVIELPPEEGGASPAPGAAPPAATAEESVRTSKFSDLKRKAEAIVNRTVLGGYGEFAFTKREGQDSYFEARRFVAFLYSPIHERISLTAEIEFEHGGSPLKTQGQTVPGEVQLEFASLDIKFFDQLILRGGIVLVPFGRFNINHDAPTQDLTDRPLVLTYLIPSTWFEAGVGLVGRQKLPHGFELSHELYLINGFDSKIADGQGFRAARGSKLEDNNDDKAVVGRVGLYFFGPVAGRTLQVDLGVSGYSGEYDRRGHRALLVGADLGLRVAGFELSAEVARAFNDAGFDDDYSISARTPIPTDMWGMFVEARYHVMPAPLRRRLPAWLKDSMFTLIARYDLVDTDMRVNSAGDKQRVTFGLNYRFIQAVVWKHELQLDHQGAHNPFDDPALGYVSSFAFLF
jgi:hypothetical protein